MRAIPHIGLELRVFFSFTFNCSCMKMKKEDGKTQLRMISIDDRAKSSRSKSVALFGRVGIVAKLFNSIFGQEILSATFVGTSICWSFAGLIGQHYASALI